MWEFSPQDVHMVLVLPHQQRIWECFCFVFLYLHCLRRRWQYVAAGLEVVYHVLVSTEVISRHRNVWIKSGWVFVMIFLRLLVSFVHRAAACSLGLAAWEPKGRWDIWSSWARGPREPRDLHEYFMLHMKYHGPRMPPQLAGDRAALVCS